MVSEAGLNLRFSLTGLSSLVVPQKSFVQQSGKEGFLVLRRRTNAFGFSLVLLATAFLLPSCAKRNEEAKSVEPAPRVASTTEPAARVLALASPTPSPTPASKPSAPPNPTEIRDTVARVFDKAATPDISREPNFAIGDFNDDSSDDLAGAIKSNERS